MRVLQEICQLGSLRGDSQIGCSVILVIPCLAAGDYWGGDWPGDPVSLPFGLGTVGLWLSLSPGSVWIPVDSGICVDHHHLQQRWGSVAFG